MPYLTNLATIARRTGFPVVEQPGWKTRGHGPMGPVRSIICHHDAAKHDPKTFNSVVQNGHSTLAGPLAHFALRRDGTIHVVAAGLAYHAGVVSSPETYGNSYSIGIEAGNDGLGEPWPDVQLRAYKALCAELCKAFGLPASRVQGHKEVASPRGRKPDPAGIDMAAFRRDVAALMKPGGGGAAPAAPKRNRSRYMRMSLPAGKHAAYFADIPSDATHVCVAFPRGTGKARLIFHGDANPNTYKMAPEESGIPDFSWKGDYTHDDIDRLRSWRKAIPEGATGVSVYWEYYPDNAYDTAAGAVSFRYKS